MTALLLRGGRRTFLSLRKHRNYRLFFTGQVVSVSGTWMQNIAMYWFVLTLTHDPLAIGILSFCRFGPFTVFGLFSGVIADRFDNRRTVILTQSVQMVLSAILAIDAVTGHATPWHVYIIAALMGTALVLDAPARQSLTFQMVGRDELPNAIALNSSLFNIARIAGPALGGIVIAAVGVGWCFASNAVSFLAVLASLLLMRTSEMFPLARRRRPTILRGTREGLSYAMRDRNVVVILGMMVVFASLCFNFNILLPVLAKQTLDAGPRTFGILSAAFGAGALHRCARRRGDGTRPLAHDADRRGRLRGVRAADRARPVGAARRGAPLLLRDLLHVVHGELERPPAARLARSPPRPRPVALLLRVERARAARRADRRLALGDRRNRARVHRRRHRGARDGGRRRARAPAEEGSADRERAGRAGASS